MPFRSPKMNSFIFGFQRFVWWPKCTPASSRSFIAIAVKLPPNAPVPDTLALAELEALARPGQAVFLALLGAGVAREEAVFLERLAKLGVERHERAGDAEPHGAGLAGHAAAVHRHQHVELVGGLGQDERLLDGGAQRFGGEGLLEGAPVDRDGATAGPKVDPCGR